MYLWQKCKTWRQISQKNICSKSNLKLVNDLTECLYALFKTSCLIIIIYYLFNVKVNIMHCNNKKNLFDATNKEFLYVNKNCIVALCVRPEKLFLLQHPTCGPLLPPLYTVISRFIYKKNSGYVDLGPRLH